MEKDRKNKGSGTLPTEVYTAEALGSRERATAELLKDDPDADVVVEILKANEVCVLHAQQLA